MTGTLRLLTLKSTRTEKDRAVREVLCELPCEITTDGRLEELIMKFDMEANDVVPYDPIFGSVYKGGNPIISLNDIIVLWTAYGQINTERLSKTENLSMDVSNPPPILWALSEEDSIIDIRLDGCDWAMIIRRQFFHYELSFIRKEFLEKNNRYVENPNSKLFNGYDILPKWKYDPWKESPLYF